MKLNDLVDEPMLEVRVEAAMKVMDWNFDIDATDEGRLQKGAKALRQLESLVMTLHDIKPELAHALWEAYCPYAQPGSLPATLLRR